MQQRDLQWGSILGATQTSLTSFVNHGFLVALGLLYLRNAVDIAENDGELSNKYVSNIFHVFVKCDFC